MTELQHAYSYGGGVQSTAMLVLAATGYLPPGPFLFANVGDDSEHPATLDYVRDVAWDYAASHGIEIHELRRIPSKGRSAGQEETLYQRLMRPGSRSLPIPLRMSDTGAPGTRSCTADHKIAVVGKWLRDHGASAQHKVHVGIGISTDEIERANNRRANDYEQSWYPLLHLEHRLAPYGASRDQCAAIIRDAGLPVPPKSSCYFCPFNKPTVWNDMARDEPALFDKACHIEETLNARRSELNCPGAGAWPAEATIGLDRDASGELDADDYEPPTEARYDSTWSSTDGRGACPSCRSRQQVELVAGEWRLAQHARGPVYLTRFGKPLRSVFANQQLSLLAPGWDEDEGYRCGDVCDT